MSRRRLSLPSTRSEEPDLPEEPEAAAVEQAASGAAVGVVATLTGADLMTPITVDQVPAPYEAHGTGGLSPEERADLETCERAVAGLQSAFTVAGKALATINAARLYRESHPTFAAYVEDRWGIKRAHAYRWIEGWPIAAALSPRGDIPEKHVRALLPTVKQHGLEAGRAVYEALREQDARVTASRITQAVRILPSQLASPEQAGDVVRVAAVDGRLRPGTPMTETAPQSPTAPSGSGLTDGAEALAILGAAIEEQRRLYDRLAGVVPLALSHDPGQAAQLLRELRQYLQRTAYRVRPERSEET